MKNYIQPGENITVTAPYDVLSGAGALVSKMFGVASGDALSGKSVTLVRVGVFGMKKTSAQAWTEGAKVYWDDAAKECTTTVGTNTLIGCAVEAAANPTSIGKVLLDGAIRA